MKKYAVYIKKYAFFAVIAATIIISVLYICIDLRKGSIPVYVSVHEQKTGITFREEEMPTASEIASEIERSNRININFAPVKELTELKALNLKSARAIVAYREQNGYFSAVSDLLEMELITNEQYLQIEAFITV